MFPVYDIDQLLHDVGVLCGKIVVLVEVGGEVVKVGYAPDDDEFPIAHADGYLVGLVKFPIEKVVFRLLLVFAEEGGGEGDAVEAVLFVPAVQVFLRETFVADEVAEGGQEVVEGKLVVVDRTGRDMSCPAGNEGNADAAFVALAFQPAEFAVASEKGGVGAALFVGTVVAGEDDQGVSVQAFFFQFVHDFTDVGVEAGNHGGELGVGVFGGVVTGTFAAAPGLVFKEFPFVVLQDAVPGLGKFGMGQGIGEDA